MALDVPHKLPHPIATALMEQYGEDFFLKAKELNDIVAAIKSMQQNETKLKWKIDNWG